MTIDDQIRDKKLQYDIYREAAKRPIKILRISPCGNMQTRITPNMDTFYAVKR